MQHVVKAMRIYQAIKLFRMSVTDTVSYINSKDQFNLEHFFELSADLFCIAGFDGYFKKINSAVSKTLGYTNEELLSMPIDSFVHFEDRGLTSKKRENIKNDQPLLNFENRYVTKSGEIVWLSWTSMPVKNENLVFAIAKNITHQKKLEKDRNGMITNLTKINNNLKHLTYSTSHDLRSPVSNLLSVFSLWDISKITDIETLEFISLLKSSTEILKNTLDNYVNVLSQKNVLDVYTEELDLYECLNLILKSLGSLIQNSCANIHIDFSRCPTVKFNRAYLESIFLNLLTNSIKYAMPNRNPVISIYSKYENGFNQLVFEDEGQGFDMDNVKDKIFGFNQKFNGNADSIGIGLYLVHNHVVSLGGRIDVKSVLNEGACFTISFKS